MPHSLQVSYDMHTMREEHGNSNDGAESAQNRVESTHC